MSGSNVYFRFGTQHRYPYDWRGGAGGVLRAQPNGAVLELGSAFGAGAWPAFARTRAHAMLGDWPLVRPAGPEPIGALSDNERRLAFGAAAAAAALLLWRLAKRRRGRGRRRR